MSKLREQLAASLLNHVFVVEQSLVLGRRSRRPTSTRYSEISTLDFSKPEAVNEVMKSFIAFNSKHFIENLRFAVDKQIAKTPGLSVSWSPKILVRGLGGRLVADGIDYNIAAAIVGALNFSRQSPDLATAMELAGGVSPFTHEDGRSGNTALEFLIPAFKTAPFCNLEREQEDFNKILAAKLLVMRALILAHSSLSEEQRREVIAGRANILVTVVKNQPTAVSLEETDSARAQRIARERLEEIRRRRTMTINEIMDAPNQLTYDVSPVIATDERQQMTISTDTLFGW
jgi:hypothetical protein